ncbi:DNA replication/repair protein RecF [bacterium]|nr:DNA replication/repair protein RecF [bacterium]
MRLVNLSLTNFRNYKKESINLSPSTNIFIGNNAQGKTNILEAIYTLALARSYKAKDKDMIMNGAEFYKISALIDFFNRDEELIMIGANEGKKVFAGGREIKKISDFIGKLNVVLFSPDDLLMLKNGPQEKRKLMDMSLLQISKQYIDDYTAFKKQLKLRNDYLKYLLPKINEEETVSDDMLDVLTSNFISTNTKIYEFRKNFIDNLAKLTTQKYALLSGEKTTIRFEYQINFKNNLDFYKEKYKSDITAGSTQFGCHRDDIKFYKDDQDFETACSQGEMRMLSLSIKLALADMLKTMKNEAPVLLLDDVFSELDKNHQNRLLTMLDKSMQIIITTTDIYKIGKLALDNAKVFMINHGAVKEAQANG